MSDAWNEDEWVAAFLDGRLDERQRAEMLARLTIDPEAYEHFAATAAILRQAEEAEKADAAVAADEDGTVALPGSPPAGAPMPRVVVATDAADAREPEPDRGVTPLHPRRPATAVRWLALAAGIAALALAGRALRPRTSPAEGPVRLAMRLEHPEQRLSTDWIAHRPWSSPRGEDQGGNLTQEEKAARAARAGAELVDLAVAIQGRDTIQTQLLAGRIDELYGRSGRQSVELREIMDGAGGPPDRLRPLVERATDRIVRRLEHQAALELGAWTEAARLAADRKDVGFFRDPRTRSTLDRLVPLAAADPPARAAAERVRLLLPEGAAPLQWDALVPALAALARAIASD